ncbi:esterase-like activity of phytase family protein [Ruegeria sediminis]|uniref:Esterase-like activity of phytase family protein n=1 Tax=Ruegeria sediminis TaxID=2583820 RepID=A0ABY2WVV3_9RHOB|nr:esterase-like activity of phytase family protein [Ruegeria sediminis]TMV06883.1 esterase-like activity of phytase family protein [Ruegeria sediminis]
MRLRLALQLIPALLLGGAAYGVDVRSATHLGSFAWHHDAEWFGGWSGLELSDDGQSMTVLSDRARIATARIPRVDGRIAAVEDLRHWPVRSSGNSDLQGRAGDSEGLAIAPDGTIYISFEAVPRVARYAAMGGPAEVLPRAAAFRDQPINGSLEALAMDGQGRLYTMSETARSPDGRIPVHRWDGRSWTTPFTLPERGGFAPVAADFGPDGRLYVLERAATLIAFRSRLRRWEVTEDGVGGEETLFATPHGRHDNLEGLSVWRDAEGALRATMVSDDNFFGLQRTELVEYALPD